MWPFADRESQPGVPSSLRWLEGPEETYCSDEKKFPSVYTATCFNVSALDCVVYVNLLHCIKDTLVL